MTFPWGTFIALGLPPFQRFKPGQHYVPGGTKPVVGGGIYQGPIKDQAAFDAAWTPTLVNTSSSSWEKKPDA